MLRLLVVGPATDSDGDRLLFAIADDRQRYFGPDGSTREQQNKRCRLCDCLAVEAEHDVARLDTRFRGR